LDEAKATKWEDDAKTRGEKALDDYLWSQKVDPSTLSKDDILKLENFASTEDWQTWFESRWEGDPDGLTPEQRGKLHLEIYRDRFTAQKEEKELTEKNIPAVSDNEMDALIEDTLLGYEKELDDADIAELKFLLATPNLTREQQVQIVSGTGSRLIRERRRIIAAEEAADFTRTDAEKQVRDFYVNSGYNIGEIPDEIIDRDAADVFRAGGLSPELKRTFADRLEGEVGALLEAEGFKTATGNLTAFGLNVAADAGVIGPTTSAEFAQHFQQSTIPRIARAAALSGLTKTEEIRQFFLDEFRLQLKTGEISQSRSKIGLMPMDVRESDFRRQLGIGGGDTSRLLGIRPEAPFPDVGDSQFLPFAREAAGDDPNLYSYLLGQIPELQRGFRTARQGFERQLSLENLQQATQFAQAPERLASLEAELRRAGVHGSAGANEANIERIQAEIAQQRANLTISENLPAFRRSQAADVQRQGEGFSAEGFFEKRRAGLIEGFRSTATGFAGEVAARRRAEADTERATRQVEFDAEQAEIERRRQLRKPGRTVMRV
jgi:hypothetical protein